MLFMLNLKWNFAREIPIAMFKKTAIFLIIVFFALPMVNVIYAQNIPKPSVPEFAGSLINDASVSGYTSPRIVINGIKINITNQPYAYSFNGTSYVLCYDYRYKAHSAQNWEESLYSLNNSYPPQSNSNTTILTIQEISVPQQPDDIQIDFQVQAIVGHYYQTETGIFFSPDEPSDWSPTYTITFPRPTPSLPYPPSPSPTIPEFSGWIILPLLIIMGLIVYLKKEKIE
jgi:hypothetical protein